MTGLDRTSLWYGFVVFASSACLLVLEIAAGRLLAPYIGVSLYTWTSIIGVILAGMAVGNWCGGRLADRNPDRGVVGVVLAVSGVASLGILLLLTLLAPWVQSNVGSLLGASFVYVLALFFLPALFLGVVTPLVITMNLRVSQTPGRVVGRLHALAALGSIGGTFVTGFWLIQWFGTRSVIIATGFLLILLGVPFFWKRAGLLLGAVLMALLVLGLGAAMRGFADPCDRETRYYCIRVVEENAAWAGGAGRSLILDHMTHSTNHRERPDYLLSPYVHGMDELIRHFMEPGRLREARFLFAGGGAYTHPRAIRATLPAADITVVELDPGVTDTAVDRMFVDTTAMTVIHEDIGRAMQRLPEAHYDVAVLDVFHDLAIPYHLATREFFLKVRERMVADGLFVMNVVDVFPDPLLVKALFKTLSNHFSYVDVWMERPPDEATRLTYVISANNSARFPPRISARRGLERAWFKVNDAILGTGTAPARIPELSNDYAPVERLLSPLYFSASGL